MEKITAFVQQHLTDDLTKLILTREKWQDIDMELAVNCIESRRKLKGKVQAWYDNPALIFPLKLSAEQCSSTRTGEYKADFASRIAQKPAWRIADLTGGLGVDSWCFSKTAAQVLYCEMQEVLCRAAEYNFQALGSGNISVINYKTGESSWEILQKFAPDIVYMDPARRSEKGRKVFLIEECTPDVITLKEDIFKISRHILLKLSPMADIAMICERLGEHCREVHAVASGGECKELLVWLDREWEGEHTISAVELRPDAKEEHFTFMPSEERNSIGRRPPFSLTGNDENLFLFEPGKALMKAGAFNLIAEKFGIYKLGASTHYYAFKEEHEEGKTVKSALHERLKQFGKVYHIIRCEPLNKHNIKKAGMEFPNADVTARNILMDTDTLRRRLGISERYCKMESERRIHLFGLKSDSESNLLIVTTPS